MSSSPYEKAGVSYSALDWFKRMAQELARETAHYALLRGAQEVKESRGESVYLLSTGNHPFVGFTPEGPGTKSLVADALCTKEKTYYDVIGYDGVASIVNDMLALGILPAAIGMILAAGNTAWFQDRKKPTDLLHGWLKGCHDARCTWGPGETQILKNLIIPDKIVLAGTAIGFRGNEQWMVGSKIKKGDAILLFPSSGIHTNGLTLCDELKESLPQKYATKVTENHSFGELLLTPSLIYCSFIEECVRQKVVLRYAPHITGHGWPKLLRAEEAFTYIIERLPEEQPIFPFIQERTGMSDRDMYNTFNMGAGFAVFIPEFSIEKALEIARQCKFKAFIAGFIEKGPKRVIIKPKDIEYGGKDLDIRYTPLAPPARWGLKTNGIS
ncbi:MAG: AIR synthase-related protein [bacterium]|nr:AIR synthase-related protein [bacterium]